MLGDEFSPLQMNPPHWYADQPRPIKHRYSDGYSYEFKLARRHARMKGQAEGLIVGILFAGFFGLLLSWSF